MTTVATLETARSEAAEAKELAAAKESELRVARRATAERAVENAIRHGVIPPLNRKLRNAWLTACEKDAAIVELLAMMPGRPMIASKREPSPFYKRSVDFSPARTMQPVEETVELPTYCFK